MSSHKNLDRYCLENEEDLSINDLRVLRALDRICWLRFYAASQNPNLADDVRRDTIDKFKLNSKDGSLPGGDGYHQCYFEAPLGSIWSSDREPLFIGETIHHEPKYSA
eukprot:TRINITY_DN749_c2_g1_i1.p1 TRINITY_DN749_c2_g1~~TRINITY_DN749_c2_g1_i1.p1  ORF type:complete len:108 (-),score=23.03 TRINITY_DN749_c2_g1_i1:26-349(-)